MPFNITMQKKTQCLSNYTNFMTIFISKHVSIHYLQYLLLVLSVLHTWISKKQGPSWHHLWQPCSASKTTPEAFLKYLQAYNKVKKKSMHNTQNHLEELIIPRGCSMSLVAKSFLVFVNPIAHRNSNSLKYYISLVTTRWHEDRISN